MRSLKSAVTLYPCLKDMPWKHTAYHVDKSDIGCIHLKSKWRKYMSNFCQPIQKRRQEGTRSKKRTRSWSRVKLLCFERLFWSQNPAKFSGHKSCECADIIFSIWPATNVSFVTLRFGDSHKFSANKQVW